MSNINENKISEKNISTSAVLVSYGSLSCLPSEQSRFPFPSRHDLHLKKISLLPGAETIHTVANILGAVCSNRFQLDISVGRVEHNHRWLPFSSRSSNILPTIHVDLKLSQNLYFSGKSCECVYALDTDSIVAQPDRADALDLQHKNFAVEKCDIWWHHCGCVVHLCRHLAIANRSESSSNAGIVEFRNRENFDSLAIAAILLYHDGRSAAVNSRSTIFIHTSAAIDEVGADGCLVLQ